MIPQQQIDQIKQAANDDIVSIVEDYVKLKRSGNSYKGLCPFHDENTPSFSVSEAKRIYKCFGCDQSGDAIDFIMMMEGYDFIEAIRALAGRFGVIIDEEKSDRSRDYTPPNAVIPGIREAKRHIRKAEKAIICFNKDVLKKLHESNHQNALQLKKLGSDQAQLLAKYTEDITLICQGVKQKRLFQTLLTAHKNNISVKMAITSNDQPQHWSKFITEQFPHNQKIKKACIKILSAIPDGVTRSIETQSFANFWDKSN